MTDLSTEETFLILTDRYRDIILSSYNELLINSRDKYTHPEHLLSMLDIIINDLNQSVTKKHRWLGCIQGILIANDILLVDAERNFTRNILNGR